MSIDVTPISLTQVDWPQFLRKSTEILGDSPSRVMDSCNLPLKTPFGFLATIANFRGSASHPVRAVKDMGYSLRHYSMGFLIECPIDLLSQLGPRSELVIDRAVSDRQPMPLYIVTGNLFQWRSAIVANMIAGINVELREVLGKVLAFLEQAGLGDLFSGFSKRAGYLLE